MVNTDLTPKTGGKQIHRHSYRAKALNRRGVALRCACGTRAQWFPVWNPKKRR